MLQNACRELWNYTQESQSIANHSHSHKDAFPITREFLRNTVWLPFYLASDMIIDMITELQASNSLKVKIQRQYTLYIHAFCRDNFFLLFFLHPHISKLFSDKCFQTSTVFSNLYNLISPKNSFDSNR